LHKPTFGQQGSSRQRCGADGGHLKRFIGMAEHPEAVEECVHFYSHERIKPKFNGPGPGRVPALAIPAG